MDLDTLPFVQAKNYTKGRRAGITLIVIHDMEAGESASTAENCARYFATTDVRASAHYCCDENSTVCSVKPEDTAWHTGHRATNDCSIGIEQAGFASQSPEQWDDVASRDMIFGEVAPLVAALSQQYNIPLRILTAGDLKAGNFSGVTTHAAISEAFVPGGHTDPGPNYPLEQMVAAAVGANTPSTVDPQPAGGSHNMISLLTLPQGHPLAGAGIEFRAVMGGVVARWQTSPGGDWTEFATIAPAPPTPVNSVAARAYPSGVLEVLAWNTADPGKVYRAWQTDVGSPYQAWLGV